MNFFQELYSQVEAKANNAFSTSIFGFVEKKMNKLSSILSGSVDITTEEYKFPEIVIVGDEKNGKSSLLENITKCKIFPKDRGYCTKRPIRFILRNADEVSFSISFSKDRKVICKTDSEIRKLITEEFDKGLSTEEIVVECSAPGNHNFEFVDLPGIKAYPEEMATSTKAITNRYLANKNNIVILAYSATTPSEANCSTLSLIKKHERQKDTIFVMTMLDKLGDSEDIKFAHSQKFGEFDNRFYVISGEGTDEFSWFKKNNISGNVTAQKLLSHTQTLFIDYVNKNWYKNIVANLEKQKTSLTTKRDGLNPLTENDANKYRCVLNMIFSNIVDSKDVHKTFIDTYNKNITYSDKRETSCARYDKSAGFVIVKGSVEKANYPDYETIASKVVLHLTEEINKEFTERVDDFLSCDFCNHGVCDKTKGRSCLALSFLGVDHDGFTRVCKHYSIYSDALVVFREKVYNEIKQRASDFMNDKINKLYFMDLVKYRNDTYGRGFGEARNRLKFYCGVDFTVPELTRVNASVLEEQDKINKQIDELEQKIKKIV